jgi:hypothetical protein
MRSLANGDVAAPSDEVEPDGHQPEREQLSR